MVIFLWIIQVFFISGLSPLGVGFVRKLKAKFQNRQGASIFQPYKDLWKLFHKDEIISTDASWIFTYTPIIIFATTFFVGASVPLFASFFGSTLASDMLVIIYTLAIGTFFLTLAGIDVGSAFGGFGSSREMTISALAEGGLLFVLLSAALRSNSTNLFTIATAEPFMHADTFLPTILAFFGFFIVLLAETARFPFDNPATHLELTMIHEAMILEYSGKKLALMEWASASKLLIFASLGVNLFFPWGMANSTQPSIILLSGIIFVVKILVVYTAVAVLESSIAKFRYFRLPDLLMVAFVLGGIGIALLI
ncbi:MAG: NADH-quinone oxidoreductase subunit H [Patescibacteria group bacterium]